ncbi:TlpA disulfide reductase family protein [Chitinophaga caseinilytica]|uniref:TlpA disulfide reductase family protein n=1 Tax=Chitinophaga caseinilytica TaxID=2267521 RepID=A0ABZ2Z3M7_9BACT
MKREFLTEQLSGDSGFVNMPDCEHHTIRRFHLKKDQDVFERYAQGKIEPSRFLQFIQQYQIDTNLLSRSPQPANSFHAFVGLDSRGRKIVIVDVNQDRNFGNDSTWLFDTSYFGKPDKDCPPLPEIALPGPNGPAKIKLNPYQAYFGKDGYSTPEDRLLELVISVDAYWIASLEAGGKKQKIFAWDQGINLLQDPRSKNIVLKLEEDSTSKYVYRKGEKIKTGNAVLAWTDTSASVLRQYPVIAFRQVSSTQHFEADKGSYVPDFETKDLITGKTVSISGFKGKYVILDFWGTWCNPCVAMIPEMRTEHEQLKGKPVVFISVALDRTADEKKLRRLIDTEKMDWVQLWQKWENKSEDDSLTKLFKVIVFPTSILISPSGEILHRGTAADGFQKTVEILKTRLKG